MIKNRFIWRRKHQVFVFKGCGGSSVDIALWFQSTASSLNLWKLIISFQQYFVSELYSSFEIILLGKITSLGALHMLLCLTRCPLTKHQACCEMLVRAHLKRPIASVWHFFCCKFSSPYRSNFTRHPTLFLFCKEQLPVLGSSVCFVAAFGLVSAEQQSTVVNANTVNIVNIQDWAHEVKPSPPYYWHTQLVGGGSPILSLAQAISLPKVKVVFYIFQLFLIFFSHS